MLREDSLTFKRSNILGLEAPRVVVGFHIYQKVAIVIEPYCGHKCDVALVCLVHYRGVLRDRTGNEAEQGQLLEEELDCVTGSLRHRVSLPRHELGVEDGRFVHRDEWTYEGVDLGDYEGIDVEELFKALHREVGSYGAIDEHHSS